VRVKGQDGRRATAASRRTRSCLDHRPVPEVHAVKHTNGQMQRPPPGEPPSVGKTVEYLIHGMG
jgi:hypothetical protein